MKKLSLASQREALSALVKRARAAAEGKAEAQSALEMVGAEQSPLKVVGADNSQANDVINASSNGGGRKLQESCPESESLDVTSTLYPQIDSCMEAVEEMGTIYYASSAGAIAPLQQDGDVRFLSYFLCAHVFGVLRVSVCFSPLALPLPPSPQPPPPSLPAMNSSLASRGTPPLSKQTRSRPTSWRPRFVPAGARQAYRRSGRAVRRPHLTLSSLAVPRFGCCSNSRARLPAVLRFCRRCCDFVAAAVMDDSWQDYWLAAYGDINTAPAGIVLVCYSAEVTAVHPAEVSWLCECRYSTARVEASNSH